MALSDRIKSARLAAGYTQRDLAKLVNVKPVTVSAWEVGRNEPSLSMLKKLADVLNTSFERLTGSNSDSSQKTADLADDNVIFTYEGKKIPPEDLEYMKRILRGGKA